jgi:hypothetical protein
MIFYELLIFHFVGRWLSMKKRSGLLILLGLLLLLSACSPGADKPADKPEETIKPAAKDPEGMVMEGPGKFAGKAYDEAKVRAELKKWPKDMTADEVYNRLVWLMAEDYKPIVKEAKEYEPPFSVSKLRDFDPDSQKHSDKQKQEKNKRKNVVILIDSSGSMAGRVNGKTKMAEAKKAVKEFAASLEGDIRIAIRAYGHKGTNQKKDKELSCASTEELYPLSAYQEERFTQVIDSLKPSGWTPLAAAIRGAGEDLASAHPEDENIVYVVSDGIESCGGDPVKEAKALHQSKIKAVVNIIGFDLDQNSRKSLEQVAKAGGGEFTHVRSAQEMRNEFDRGTYLGRWSEVFWWYSRNAGDLFWARTREINKIEKMLGGVWDRGKIASLCDVEYERMTKALEFLIDQQIVPESMGGSDGEVTKKLDHRKKMIVEYQEKLASQKFKQIEREYDRLIDFLEETKKRENEKLEPYLS